jgi:hypothetical protein
MIQSTMSDKMIAKEQGLELDTEGSRLEVGPSRRSAVEITLAIDLLEVVELRSAEFHDNAKASFCMSRQRMTPAQPSTRHD